MSSRACRSRLLLQGFGLSKVRPVLSNSFAWEIASRKLFYFFGSAFLLRTRVYARALNSSKKSHIRTFSGVSARRCSAGLSSCAMIPATELFGSTRRSVLCSLFLSSGFVVARAWAFGASSVHFSLPRPLLSPERAREASGIVCRHADEGCPEEQLHRTRGCVTFCSRLRLVAFARRARASLF